ncbi:hypothetical protein HUW51_20190 [Adhaeribacter swui]|uniref:SCP domain-containing protein n=1 Tax=Adhaeribacter swui TaxID=2086471 RepID=A0A7G7GCP4_9BACT|nr:hypothetical protein HUW51_20190 [Adhaeribacter swui]
MLLVFWCFVVSSVFPQELPEPDYYDLSWQEFEQLPAARQVIPLLQPNYNLLDAAIYHVTNKIRATENKPPLKYSGLLHRTATYHAQTMIELDFYNHLNYQQLTYLTPDKRIAAFGGVFNYTAENIAQYDIVNTDLEYCPFREKNGSFIYLNCDTKKPYRPYTYLAYAERVVNGWLHSPSHRKSLLSLNYQYIGCSARISKNPYQQKKVPFARLVQNFGGYGSPADSASAVANTEIR